MSKPWESMTEAERQRWVAERVMGWRFCDRVAMGWGDGPPVWSTGADPEDPNSSPTFQDFRPTENVGHAWRVVEEFSRSRKVWFGISYASPSIADVGMAHESCAVSVYPLGDMQALGEATAPTMPAAVCHAAYLALTAKEPADA